MGEPAGPHEQTSTDLSLAGKVVAATVTTAVCVVAAVGVGYLGILVGIWLGFLPLWDDGGSYPHSDAWWAGTLIAAVLVACVPLLALARGRRRTVIGQGPRAGSSGSDS